MNELPLNTINLSDNIEFIKTLPDNSIDAIITDSPYGLGKEPKAAELILDWVTNGYHEIKGKGFMGKQWDAFVPQPALWKECYRVLKPGGYLLSFFGTRTYDWGTLAIRLAGFEIRDCIQWIYGSGFPKSKSHLKPANEPICVARKPGALFSLNVEECRIGGFYVKTSQRGGMKQSGVCYGNKKNPVLVESHPDGRLPSNVILDEYASELIDEQSGIRFSGGGRKGEPGKRAYIDTDCNQEIFKDGHGLGLTGQIHYDENNRPYVFTSVFNDTGGASRFFYVAKTCPSERAGMKHPTIKPVKLMTQLVKLYCPHGGVCLDPHFGTGPTGEACLETGRNFIGIDNDPQSVEEAKGRIDRWYKNQDKQINLF